MRLLTLMMQFLALGLGCINMASAANVRVEIQGLDAPLKDNVLAHFGQTNIAPNDLYWYERRLVTSAKTALRALGYYEPEIITQTKKDSEGNPSVLIATINAGPVTKLIDSTVTVTGAGLEDRRFSRQYRALSRRLPKAGTPLNHQTYENFKSDLLALGMQNGYFDAKLVTSQLLVSPTNQQARWNLEYETGQRYHIGQIHFSGNQIDEDYLVGLIPFKTGDGYLYTRYAQFNNQLNETGWFSSVVIKPTLDRENHIMDLDVEVTPRKANQFEVGVGYETDVGPRGSFSWRRPWLNRYGHSFEVLTDLSPKEQELDFSYKIPSKTNPLTHYWLIQSGYKYTDLNDTQSNQIATGLSRFVRTASGWTRQMAINYLFDSFTQGMTNDDTSVIYPEISLTRTKKFGGSIPIRLSSTRVSVKISQQFWGSDLDFLILEGTQVYERTFARKHRLVGRVSAGWMETNDFDAVPPDLRFFAGGDLSVRGYDYKGISPKDASGELTGGSRLITASAEYQYRVKGNWWGAMFFDVGQASHDFSMNALKKGAGVGVRWQSPVGPIKFDIAHSIGDSEENSWHFYIGLGGTF